MRYWLSRKEGEVIGPFTRDELAAMGARGELVGPSGLPPQVCPEGQRDWRAIGLVPELAGILGGSAGADGSSGPDQRDGIPTWPTPSTWATTAPPGSDPLGQFAFSFENVFSLGWAAFKSRYGLLLGATVLTIAISLAGAVLVEGLMALSTQMSPGPGRAAAVLFAQSTNLGFSFFVNMPLSVGLGWLAVRIVRGQPASIGDLMAAYRRLFHVLAAALLVSVMMIAASLPFLGMVLVGIFGFGGPNAMSSGQIALIAVAAAGLLAVMLYLSARLLPTYLLTMDPEASPTGPFGPVASISESWRITRGRTLTLVALLLVLGMLIIVTFMACVLPGLFFGYPLAIACYGAGYALLVGGRQG